MYSRSSNFSFSFNAMIVGVHMVFVVVLFAQCAHHSCTVLGDGSSPADTGRQCLQHRTGTGVFFLFVGQGHGSQTHGGTTTAYFTFLSAMTVARSLLFAPTDDET